MAVYVDFLWPFMGILSWPLTPKAKTEHQNGALFLKNLLTSHFSQPFQKGVGLT
ncbi:hypothetical protein KKC1_26730 [Calderihabitans maritimus]|uniref:Uncharacterized protein n=1 Tax=Calderihabitans maritimus TaxID=1246530 RepID=A0A1Z5HVJ1_9FIRM|nr:hypothetical protein KKC1_26730 [Calderihabitans maritimus]